jgi:hypothetical protein
MKEKARAENTGRSIQLLKTNLTFHDREINPHRDLSQISIGDISPALRHLLAVRCDICVRMGRTAPSDGSG